MSIPEMGHGARLHEPEVTEVDGRMDVLTAMKVMKKVGSTSLIVKRRDEDDEYGLLLFSDIAKQVIARNRAPERSQCLRNHGQAGSDGRPDMKVRYCARLFENFRISHAPVEEDGKIIGMVSYYRLMLHGLPDLD